LSKKYLFLSFQSIRLWPWWINCSRFFLFPQRILVNVYTVGLFKIKTENIKHKLMWLFYISQKISLSFILLSLLETSLIIDIVLSMSIVMGLILILCLIGLFGQLEWTFEDNFIVVLSGVRLLNVDCVEAALYDWPCA